MTFLLDGPPVASLMISSDSENAFTVEQHGDVTVIIASPALEDMDPTLVEGASTLLRDPIQASPMPLVLFDLGKISAFGSAFLAILIRCWKDVSKRGGVMAMVNASPSVRDLLRVTKFDQVWPIYENRPEAIAALESD